ncbi:MAG: DUF368 domain-containing protein [Bacteroidales bacterium]|nr:DUF368 domain-containing protein [Bacteroidales bacterium]
MLKHIILFFKGFSMGLANVVPGVSGGTIALLAGIFERFVNALKSFDLEALKLLKQFKFKEFASHTDLLFLTVLFLGEGISILTAAKVLEYLFKFNDGIYVWAFFFGLILASVYYIGKTIGKFTPQLILLTLLGASVAYVTSILTPASENDNIFYLIFCGAIAICDMLLPGISGSYTLILLGNYKLVVVDSISHLFDSSEAFWQNMRILLPFAIGAAIGFLAFARFLSWLMKKYGKQTTAVLTGFVFGSLGFIWPWKKKIYQKVNGHEVFNSHGEAIVEGYNKYMPDLTSDTFIAIALMIVGVVTLCAIEEISTRKSKKQNTKTADKTSAEDLN